MIRNNKLISEDWSISSMYVLWVSIPTVSPDRDRIPRKNRKKKLSEILITGNEITQETDNPSKKAKVDSSID